MLEVDEKHKPFLQFLGTGSAFTNDFEIKGRQIILNNTQSNAILVGRTGKVLLIDCGGDIRFSLSLNNIEVSDIDGVYLSHPHADHIGGIEYLALNLCFVLRKKIDCFGRADALLLIWKDGLKAGLSTIEGTKSTMDTFFNRKCLPKNGSFEWDGLQCDIVQVTHVVAERELMPSYGLLIKCNGKVHFFTSDTQFSPKQIRTFYQQAVDTGGYIWQDCETSPFKSNVHAHIDDLVSLDAPIKKSMFLYHYNTKISELAHHDVVKKGFAGFVLPTKRFIL